MQSKRRRSHRTQKVARSLKLMGVFALILFLFVGIPAWFLFPSREPMVASDAIVVMAGSDDGRHELGANLVQTGTSDNFVVSNPMGEEDNVGFSHCQGDLKPEKATQVWCMHPTPVTTTGETIAIANLAQQEGWNSVTVVTNRPHTRRVRTNLDQCTKLDFQVVPLESISLSNAPIHIAVEIAGYIKFWLNDPC